MFVPRKPWPFGNEYHTAIACCVSEIRYRMELAEGSKDKRKEFDELGKTMGSTIFLQSLLGVQQRWLFLTVASVCSKVFLK
jgi:hypothetical protein